MKYQASGNFSFSGQEHSEQPSKFGGKDLEQKFENNFKYVVTDRKVISIKRTISFL